LNSVPSNPIMLEPKRSNQVRQDSTSKDCTFKSDARTILNHTTNLRNHKSQEHSNIFNPLQINSKANHYQNLKNEKYSENVIEERESENVTSTRQNRQDSERKKNKPLQ